MESLKKIRELLANTPEAIMSAFVKRGIYECCTLQRIPGMHFPRHPEDEVRGILYEAAGPGYRDDSASRRDGVYRGVQFVHPESIAMELWEDAAQNPNLLRDMADYYMKNSVLTDEAKAPGGDYERYARPPYEAWDAREGGSVMAFRSGLMQKPEELPPQNFIRF